MNKFSGLLVAGSVVVYGLCSFPMTSTAKPDEPNREEWERQIIALVERLGDERFDEREAAHDALVRKGDAILPILNKLESGIDPEIRHRVNRIRRELGGFREEIRDLLAKTPTTQHDMRPPIFARLNQLIESHQPKSGDFLLSIIANPEDEIHRAATDAFVEKWDTMTAEQIDTFFQRSLVPEVIGRRSYPQGFSAGVQMMYIVRYGWCGAPSDGNLYFKTRTTHFLDGAQYGKPYAYQGPSACTGWVDAKSLKLGPHTVEMTLEYEFSHRGAIQKGEIRSKPYVFNVVDKDAPDDLAAHPSRRVRKAVRAALEVAETEDAFQPRAQLEFLGNGDRPDPWQPQVKWNAGGGHAGDMHLPVWRVSRELPVDLCFEVEIRDVKTGEVFPAFSLIVPKGKTASGFFCPREPQKLAQGRSGLVPVEIALRPSRGMALSCIEITNYYPHTITTGVLNVKVGGESGTDW